MSETVSDKSTKKTTATTSADPLSDSTRSTSVSAKKKKKSNILLRAGEKIGVIEQTRIAPEFIADIEKYRNYYECADTLVDGIEGILQKNPKVLAVQIQAAEKEDPHEEVSRSAKLMHQLYEHEVKPAKLWSIYYECFQKLGELHREVQLNGRRTIRKLRRFVTKEQMQMSEEHAKLMISRDIMDSARHDLKQTKTSEEVERFGKLYEGCVHDFDCQAATLEAFILILPSNKIWHIRETFEIFDLLTKFHRDFANTLDVYMNQSLKIIPAEAVKKQSKGFIPLLKKKTK